MAAGQSASACPVNGVYYRRKGVELVAQQQRSQICDMWALRDQWSGNRITFSATDLASLREALNRLDLQRGEPT